jgi:hypothetical protein
LQPDTSYKKNKLLKIRTEHLEQGPKRVKEQSKKSLLGALLTTIIWKPVKQITTMLAKNCRNMPLEKTSSI